MLTLLALWFWYVLAFAVGVAAMWLIVDRFVPARDAEQAIDDALSRELAHDLVRDGSDA